MDGSEETPRKRQRLDNDTSLLPPGAEASFAESVLITTSENPASTSHHHNPDDHEASSVELTQEEQERLVGITAYVSPETQGFRCTIKQRYTDFLVNEVLPTGEVVHLVDLGEEFVKDRAHHGSDKQDEKSRQTDDGGVAARANSELSDSHTGSGAVEGGQKVEGAVKTRDTSSDLLAVDGTNGTASDGNANATYKDRKEAVLAIIPEEDKDILDSIFGASTAESILSLYCSVVIHPERKAREHAKIKSEVISEKSRRTEAHIAVRRIFSSKLETATLTDEQNVISIKAAPVKGSTSARARPAIGENANGGLQKGKLGWIQLGGEYLHFTLYKENKDTMEVLYFIASELKVPARNFQFAGTKDRRGVTVQRIAIYRVHADRIARLNRIAARWRVGAFEYKPHGLDLGDLGGNEFVLTLRDCHFDGDGGLPFEERLVRAQQLISQAGDAFRVGGYLNYFGLQRFGTFSTGTHTIGMKMLKGDLEGAVDAILSYQERLLPENQDHASGTKTPQDDINRADAIRIWRDTRHAQKAFSRMPRRFQAESAMIQYLGKKDSKGKLIQERDWQGALMQIPRNLRMMYVHAYQSFVWNLVVGKRQKLYGNRVVEGDLVIVGEKDVVSTEANMEEIDEDGEPVIHPSVEDKAVAPEDSFTRARPLSSAEVESGRYNIFDIVFPLPGFDVLYPSNEIGEFYKTLMASDECGNLDPHQMRRSWKDISLSGDYRKVMSRPGNNFAFEVKAYAGDEQQMVATDLEKLQRRDVSTEASVAGNAVQNDKIAVVVKLQLGRSQYATMALREFTKGGASNFKPDYSTAR